MLKSNRSILCLLLVLLLTCGMQVWGQSQASTGQIAGTVKDAAGAVIIDASVKVTNKATGFNQSVPSGENGLFRIVLLPPGTYTVEVTKAGFSGAIADVEVGVGRIADVNFTLSVGGRKEEVTVTAEMVEVTRHEASAFVNSQIVADMPLNGKKFQDLALLTPSAQVDPSRQQISMVGQRGINSSINIDGSDYGNPFFGGLRGGERSNAAPTIPQEAIQEFQMVRAGYSAEFGRSTGGIMTAITKSGTNGIHGLVNYNIRPQEASRTNEFYNTATTQLRTKPGCSACTVVPAPTLQQWGGAVGGPIKKDKWFYFGSYTQQRNRLPRVVLFDKLFNTSTTRSSGAEAYDFFVSLQQPYEQTNDAKALLLKTDYSFSPNHRLSLKYGHSSNQALNATTNGTAILPTVTSALSNNGTELDSTQTGVAQLTSFFGRLANDLRVEYTRETRPRNANAQMPTVNNTIGTFGTVSFLGQNIEKDWRMQAADSFTIQRGNHSFKIGVDYSHLDAFQLFGFNQNGAFNFSTTNVNTVLDIMSVGGTIANRFDGFNCGSGGSAGACVTYLRQLGNLNASLVGDQVAAFVQDSWRVTPKLTINAGLRWEGSYNPQPQADNTGMVSKVQGFAFPLVAGRTEDPTKIPNQTDQFGPRLGFAYDPIGNGKTVIRGFGGIYYAATPLLVYAAPINNFRATPGDLSIQLPFTVKVPTGQPATGTCATATPWYCRSVYEQMNLIGINLNSYTLDKLPILTVAQVQQIATALAPAFTSAPDPFFGAQPILADRNFHNPKSYQAGFGIEREIADQWTVGMEGTWVNTVYLERNLELNLPVPILRSTTVDPAQRPYYGVAAGTARPISSLGSIQARDSSAHSLYRGLTFSSNLRRKRGQLLLYYTLSETTSNDDNERDAGGIQYETITNLNPDYSYSNLDRRHQFVAAPILFLPKGFEISSSIRLLSGAPISATLGTDANGDRNSTDRPYWAPGVSFKRNSFRNRALSFVDLRVQKAFKITESKNISLSTELFNVFNFKNLTLGGSSITNYCSSTSVITCGLVGQSGTGAGQWLPNPTFMLLRDPSTNQFITTNNSGAPFQAQFSIRFQF